ncbi:uncharacterized protein TRIADDRAFT_56755 [Trichoplax adhaerens]|uniref:EF-hand domain-containing protein n=1 Tax=Trichoplax adhaerens TaxID=10228 RepID=B3RWH9_TRIAD|nr:hypothetical protein TRIADDRAFT_56755 [Trichoplax adhaerens]EDV25138.1 hypothetical protein TRIADDRAFT_56755 [Trichoplax adhaerens]|eukprot:XP_002113028.1 hypothetical protein TRIADDRAFT_56755 [Trichoplax adhaerens]
MSACRFGSRFLSPLQVKNLRLSSSSLISQSRTLSTQSTWFNRSENSNSNQGGRSKSSLASVATVLAAGLGGVIWLYHHRQRWLSSLLPITYAAEEENQEEETVPKVVKLKKSQRRFNSYASREYMGEPVMTPHDFLQCLLGSHVTARKCRMALSQREVEEMLKKTPPASRGSAKLFRSIGHEGIITYSEFLFLVNALTKPRSGIDIAFRMIDTDCSGNIDFKEFLNLQEMISPKESKSKEADGKTDGFKSTLVAHLFGFKTNREYITFPMFEKFSTFIRSLDDFSVAMRMFAITNQCITKDEFNRALRASTRLTLDPTIVNVIFYLFDLNDDGTLHYEDFVDVLRSRRERRYVEKKANGYEFFKSCFKRQVRK